MGHRYCWAVELGCGWIAFAGSEICTALGATARWGTGLSAPLVVAVSSPRPLSLGPFPVRGELSELLDRTSGREGDSSSENPSSENLL
jgi:hypothetical protein